MSLENTLEFSPLPDHITEALERLESKVDQIYQSSKLLEKSVLDISEAAELLKISKYTLYTMTSKNILPFYKLGRKIFFDRDELIAFITRKEHRYKSNDEIEAEAIDRIVTNQKGA